MLILKLILSLILILPTNLNIDNDLSALNLSSENYLLYSVATQTILASKNSDRQLSIGSVNKILTTITILDYLDNKNLDEEVLVTQEILNHVSPIASIANLYPNQKLSIKELLYGVMLPSGADSITVLAYHIFGSIENLVERMNKKVLDLNLKNTNITNPFGLDENHQYTSLEDVLVILQYALNNPVFYELFTTKEYKLTNDDVIYTNQILKSAEILGFDNFIGAKSGFTLAAKRALASLANVSNNEYIFISNRASGGYYLDHGAMLDAIKVFEYLETYYQTKTIPIDNNHKLITLNNKEYELKTKKTADLYGLTTKKFDENDIKIIDEFKEDLKLPILKGDVIGVTTVYYQDQLIKQFDIVSLENIKKNQYHYYLIAILILILMFKLLKKFFAKTALN